MATFEEGENNAQEKKWDDTKEGLDGDLSVEDDASSIVSSSPSIPDENINFDLVYALHTFVATVDGQASVVKGDALILLEDTNIYWWLVEVLKTREVGYIPAENIETPYERLARLNKHRNVEITSPANFKGTVPASTIGFTNKRVTMGDDSSTVVIHYEVESDEEDEAEEAEGQFEKELDDDERRASRATMTAMATVARTTAASPTRDSIELTSIEEAPEPQWQEQEKEMSGDGPSLRVFAGGLGQPLPQTALFHTFDVTMATTADELVTASVGGFGIPTVDPTLEDCTVEYYLTVQGMDGDEYVLAPQDKPWAIFKTLTAPLTTPMPSPHVLAAPGHGAGLASTTRRARSSSFSSYEQTHYDEDSVFRFYLHRRIKRAHEREGLIYIKVSLYPDEVGNGMSEEEDMIAAAVEAANAAAAAGATSFATEPIKKKKKSSNRQELDRIDKIIAIRLETRVGEVINTALNKFHVPDAEADGFQPSEAVTSAREMAQYQLSVRANGKETHLRPNEMMSTVLHLQQASSPNDSGPVSGDLLFLLRRAVASDHSQQHPPSPLVGVAAGYHSKNPGLAPLMVDRPMEDQRRRPSILDILMDSPLREDTRPVTPLSPLPRQERTSSLGTLNHYQQTQYEQQQQPVSGRLSPGGGGNLHQGQQQCEHQQQYQQQQQQHLHPFSANGSAAPLTFRRSSAPSPSSSSVQDLGNMPPLSADATRRPKKESSFKQQLKRLVGWGSSAKSKKSASTPVSPMYPMYRSGSTSPLPSPSPSMTSFHTHNSSMLSPTSNVAASAMVRSSSANSSSPSLMATPHPLDLHHNSSRPASIVTTSFSAKTQVEQDEMSSSAEQRPVSVQSTISSDTCSTISTLQKEGVDIDDDDDDDESSLDDEQNEKSSKLDDAAESRAGEHLSQAETPEGPSLTDIQVQYAMWMDSQKSTDVPTGLHLATALTPAPANPKKLPVDKRKDGTLSASPSSASNASTSTATVASASSAASSCASQKTMAKNDTPTTQEELPQEELPQGVLPQEEPSAPATFVRPVSSDENANDLGDLYLLVTHGVDYLKSRESSKWEEDGGYEFHPWNRRDGSFAVREKSRKPIPMSEDQEIPVPTATDREDEESKRKEALKLLATGLSPSSPSPSTQAMAVEGDSNTAEDTLMSPPLTPQPRQQVSVDHGKVEIHTPDPPKNETDDEELQRIVAAHILF